MGYSGHSAFLAEVCWSSMSSPSKRREMDVMKLCAAVVCCGLAARADVCADDAYPEDWPDPSIDDEIVDGFPNVTGLTPLVARERIRSYLPTVVNDAKRQRSAQ